LRPGTTGAIGKEGELQIRCCSGSVLIIKTSELHVIEAVVCGIAFTFGSVLAEIEPVVEMTDHDLDSTVLVVCDHQIVIRRDCKRVLYGPGCRENSVGAARSL